MKNHTDMVFSTSKVTISTTHEYIAGKDWKRWYLPKLKLSASNRAINDFCYRNQWWVNFKQEIFDLFYVAEKGRIIGYTTVDDNFVKDPNKDSNWIQLYTPFSDSVVEYIVDVELFLRFKTIEDAIYAKMLMSIHQHGV